MAERYAVQNGLWSDTSTWNGGTLPTSSDDVHANNYTVTIDQTVTVKSLRLAAGATAVAGGVFVLDGNTPNDAVVTVLDGILAAHHQSGNGSSGARSRIIDVRDGAPDVTIDSNGAGFTAGAGQYRMAVAVLTTAAGGSATGSTGTVTVTGDITGGGGTGASGLYATGGTVTVTGDITGGSGSSAYGLQATGGTVTVTGDITGGSSAYGLYAAGGTVTVTGDITGGGAGASGLYATGGTVTVTGNITGGSSSAYGLYATGGTVTVTGDITGGGAYGLYASSGLSTDSITIDGNITGDIAQGLYQHASYAGTITHTSGLITPGAQPGVHINNANARTRLAAATSSNTQYAVTAVALNTPLAFRGPLTHAPNGRPPLNVDAWIVWDAADFQYHVRTDSLWPDNPEGNPVVVTRYGTDLPAEANVKEGVTYGPAGNYEGTLRVSDSASLADIAAVTGAQIAAATNKDA